MSHVHDLKFKPIHWQTYFLGITEMLASMTSGITKLTNEYCSDTAGIGNWLSMYHDIWTTITTNGILGSSIKLTTSTMELFWRRMTSATGPTQSQINSGKYMMIDIPLI